MTEPQPAPALTILCAPWATRADLPPTPKLPCVTDDQWDRLLLVASEQLYHFSGRQWTGGGCESTVRFGWHQDGCWGWYRPDVYWPLTGWFDWGVRTPSPSVVRIPVAPITAVTLVQIDGDPLTVGADYSVNHGSGILERIGGTWPTDGTLYVTFSYGLPPPAGGVLAAASYAVELAKQLTGDKSCRLPSNTTSVTREGVSVTLARPDNTADSRGRTGLAEVDRWLDSVNPHRMTRRPSVWSPHVPMGRRVSP